MPSRLANLSFYAIQLLPGENDHQALKGLMYLAAECGESFAGLEVFGTFKIQRNVFVRFRSDLDVGKLGQKLLDGGRGVIRGDGAVLFPGGKHGIYSMTAMCATKQVGEHRTYRGTKDKFWKRQFE